MKNKIGTFLLIIIILVVACVMVWFAHKIIIESNNPSEPASNVNNEVNKINNVNNKTENIENKVENAESNVEIKNKDSEASNIVQENKNIGMSNEEKAISIVKENWGSNQGVYFTTMGIDADGRYIVTVNDSSTTAIFASYAVNIETEEVIEQ